MNDAIPPDEFLRCQSPENIFPVHKFSLLFYITYTTLRLLEVGMNNEKFRYGQMVMVVDFRSDLDGEIVEIVGMSELGNRKNYIVLMRHPRETVHGSIDHFRAFTITENNLEAL